MGIGTPDGGSMPTPATPSEKKGEACNVMPVNIRDVLEAPEGTLTIEGTEAHMVTFIGTLEKIEKKPDNIIVHTIRDDSGVIEAIQYPLDHCCSSLNEGEDGNTMSYVGVVENTFVRVFGSIRKSSQNRCQHVRAFKVAPLTSANEITTHLLETIFVSLKLRQINKTTNNNQPVNGATAAAGVMGSPLASTSNFDSVTNQPCNPFEEEAEPSLPPVIPPQRYLNSDEPPSTQPANGPTAANRGIANPLASTSNFGSANTPKCTIIQPEGQNAPIIVQPLANNRPAIGATAANGGLVGSIASTSNFSGEPLIAQQRHRSNELRPNYQQANGATAATGGIARPLSSTINFGNVNIRQGPRKVAESLMAQRPKTTVQRNLNDANRENRETSYQRNKTTEELRQELQWGPTFNRMFQKFVSTREPEDKWTFEFLDDFKMREYRLPNVFINRAALIRFHCSVAMCRNVWESYQGNVTFWIKRNRRSANRKLQCGQALIFISGQKCKYCKGEYENGDLHENEIARVLAQFLENIEIKLYGKEREYYETRPFGRWRPKNEHIRELCQACDLGFCNVTSEDDREPPAKRNKRY